MQEFTIVGVGQGEATGTESSFYVQRPWRIATSIPGLGDRCMEEVDADGRSEYRHPGEGFNPRLGV